MEFLTPSVKLVRMTERPLELIKEMGQTCYQSDSSKSEEEFCRMLISRKHYSVLEHASMSVKVITDRGITHEIVRHRIGMSYSQESTRYVKYDDIAFIRPSNISDEKFDELCKALSVIEKCYGGILESHAPQVARAVLPNCLKTEIGITGNFNSWRHFIALRAAKSAHPDIRIIANMIKSLLPPVIVEDL